MFPVMRTASWWNGILFLVLMALMFVYSVVQLIRFGSSHQANWPLFVNGELARKYETYFQTQSRWQRVALRGWENLRFILFEEALPGVILGREGWLFINEEYRELYNPEGHVEQHVQEIKQIQERLTMQGKRLILLPIPMKLSLYPEFSRLSRSQEKDSLYSLLLSHLEAQGIPAVDTRGALLEAKSTGHVFLRTDTHWTPLAAQVAAKCLAEQFPELRGERTYQSTVVGQRDVRGDLLKFLQFSSSLAPAYFNPIQVPLYETTVQDRGEAPTEERLFGVKPVANVIVGTSYTEIDYLNFPGFLKQALSSDLLVSAIAGKGTRYAMQQFLHSELNTDPMIKTVIWEYPVRTLLQREESPAQWLSRTNAFYFTTRD